MSDLRLLSGTAERRWVPRWVRLLDVDPELAVEMPAAQAAEARRHLVVPTVTLASGAWDAQDLAAIEGVRGEVHGVLVLDGAITVDLAIDSQICTRLIAPTELVLFDGSQSDTIPVRASWTALQASRLALFDDRLRLVSHRWPDLMMAILKRAAQQIHHALLQQGISQLPRVEDRLLALMWSIADRQGRVRSDGVWLHLPVSHSILAQMIGARRPTVSLGLKTLAGSGALIRHEDDWRLAPESARAFSVPGVSSDGSTDRAESRFRLHG